MKFLYTLFLLLLLSTPILADDEYVEYNVGAFRSIVYELSEHPYYLEMCGDLLRSMVAYSDDETCPIVTQTFNYTVRHWRIWQAQKVISSKFFELR